MSSNYKREVPVNFGKTFGTHFLRFTWNSFIVFQRETGKSFDDYILQLRTLDGIADDHERGLHTMRIISPELLRTMLWVGLLHEDRNLTLDTVGEWMEEAEGDDNMSQWLYLFSRVMEAWGATKPAGMKKKVQEAARKLDETRKILAKEEEAVPVGTTSDSGSSGQPSTGSVSMSSGA